MSRRRRKPARPVVTVVCTGSGTHPRRVLDRLTSAAVDLEGADLVRVWKSARHGDGDRTWTSSDGALSLAGYGLQCPTCGLHVVFSTSERVRPFADGGSTTVDISGATIPKQ